MTDHTPTPFKLDVFVDPHRTVRLLFNGFTIGTMGEEWKDRLEHVAKSANMHNAMVKANKDAIKSLKQIVQFDSTPSALGTYAMIASLVISTLEKAIDPLKEVGNGSET